MCINCRGLGDPQAVNSFRTLLRKTSPRLVFLSETKRSVKDMTVVIRKLKNYDGITVDARGVAMLWSKGLDVTLLSMSLNHVDISVKGVGAMHEWHFTGIYGWPESHSKMHTCSMLRNLHSHCNLPWLVGGDLNEIWYNYEKNGGPDKPQSLLDNFREAFDNCRLYDLGFQGYEFTWWNRRDGA
ncbi:hypothetical protein Cgig2_005401 [Carnegiea gigantea]|uniref:Endonuclease/exonuclease/phosphatase domain-containing protein n=1 Tax=Carnegiea gigantea TaxID=171969 RepID=A0A9Q1Q6L2_9CARY|nr:hypothetical protein Cgig2_005401 [Carnegiea gigantea]